MQTTWQVEVSVLPTVADSTGSTVEGNLGWIGVAPGVRVRTKRLFLIAGAASRADADRLARDLLADPVVETARVFDHATHDGHGPGVVGVFRRQGVTDPVESSVLRAAARLGVALHAVRTGTSFTFSGGLPDAELQRIGESLLANSAIEIIQVGSDRFPDQKAPAASVVRRIEIPLRDADDARLASLSKEGGLSLTLVEMQAIRSHFREIGREPTDVELESLAQTWSEHCKHKTLTGPIRFNGRVIDNVLKRTIKAATEEIRHPFCLSVFHDNAGVIAFDDVDALCIKVETHNHPSAIEPYGGAGTGIGGVIRDILGTGRGAKPVANIDVFCVGPLDMEAANVPKGSLHPLRVLRGIVAGVRDYGNQMGIPTINGSVHFDERYVGNPLVYCGTVGILPRKDVDKCVLPGDRIVALGGRTGRDGIHGATFSSAELDEHSERVSAGAVQIGNAITEKRVADVIMVARDLNLFRAITDCGAGGFSSAVGEMGEKTGARVELDRVPLKYAGLTPSEIWISEAQERMVLAVQPEKLEALLALCRDEDVEAAVLGTFSGTGRLEIFHGDTLVGDISMAFLHDGLPKVERTAQWVEPKADDTPLDPSNDLAADLLTLLADPAIASKEWIIRQYDHEVLSGSVVKPLVGTRSHGPSDAAVNAPKPGSTRGFALGNGMAPRYGDLDPYAMAEAAIDEALRNITAVGGDPAQTAILDNFSWGNTSKPDRLGALVRCCEGCHDAAVAFGTPFVSGKDSLNNEYQIGQRTIVIPHSLLVTALAIVPDVRLAVTMDLKSAGNRLYLVGETGDDMGGSFYARLRGRIGHHVPRLDGPRARRLLAAVHQAIVAGHVRSCHDLSEGGALVAAAEMVLAGEIGADLALDRLPRTAAATEDTTLAFSESLTRFLVEVPESSCAQFEQILKGLPCAAIGVTTAAPRLRVAGTSGRVVVDLSAAALEAAWRPPLTRALEGGTTVQRRAEGSV